LRSLPSLVTSDYHVSYFLVIVYTFVLQRQGLIASLVMRILISSSRQLNTKKIQGDCWIVTLHSLRVLLWFFSVYFRFSLYCSSQCVVCQVFDGNRSSSKEEIIFSLDSPDTARRLIHSYICWEKPLQFSAMFKVASRSSREE
jgi:hypothetical protein